MRLRFLGTGAADGWPNAWCSCASCTATRASGHIRTRSAALIDERLLIDLGPDVARQADRAGVGLGRVEAILVTHGHWDHAAGATLLERRWAGSSARLTVAGPASALEQLCEWIGPNDPIDLVALAVGDRLALAGYDIVAIPATHPDDALLYDIEADQCRLLYATDTGPLTEDALELMADRRYDTVILEETFGDSDGGPHGHLDLATFPRQIAVLRACGAVTADTDLIATHLGHHNPPLDRLAKRMAPWGARVVDDLTTVDVGTPATSVVRLPAPRRMLVLGGARSGKSQYAEALLAAEPEVTYVATAPPRPGDMEWQSRVQRHRDRRPAGWSTVDKADPAALCRLLLDLAPTQHVLVDCLALWLTTLLDETQAWESVELPGAARDEVARLVDAIGRCRARVVLVSNEVGSGVVPAHRSGRLFRDELGRLNAAVAVVCDEVVLVVAGRTVTL